MRRGILGIVLLAASAAAAHAGTGESAYKRGDLDEARKVYEEALRREPGDARARYNLGNVEYRMQQLEAAQQAFQAAQAAADASLRARAAHNLGNARLLAGDLQGAIAAYEQSLKEMPGSPDTKFNLEMALRLRESPPQQQQQQQQQQQEGSQDQKSRPEQSQEQEQGAEADGGERRDPSQGQESEPRQDRGGEEREQDSHPAPQQAAGEEDRPPPSSSRGSPGEYTQEEAERILDGLADEERRLLADRMRSLGRNLRVEKDW